MATFYAGQKHYIAALNNLAAIAGLDTFSFSLANNDAVSWADASTTDIHDCLKLDASNIFNVGPQTATGSNGHLAWWANGVEKARLLASGALLIGATAALGGEVQRVDIASLTPVSNTVVGSLASGGGQSTATTAIRGFESRVTTAAAAFTATSLSHFKATGAAAGAGSTITSLFGFRADNAAAVGTNNYAFWTDFAAASNKYAIYCGGTALSYFGGGVGIGGASGADQWLRVTASSLTAATIATVYASTTFASTTLTLGRGYVSDLATAAAAFTLPVLNHFEAYSTTKGAGSTITAVCGFYAANAIAVGTNNYGFYSDIASAANTYQLYMSGTAESVIAGPLSVFTAIAAGGQGMLMYVGGAGTHPTSSTAPIGVKLDYTSPATATGASYGLQIVMRTTAAAFTSSSIRMVSLETVNKGAGSTITSLYGFMVRNAIAVGTSNFAFYSDVNSAATTYQLYMAGTALNFLKGGLILDTTAAPTVGAGQIGLGATVQTTVGAAGGASALPATPTGYMIVNIAGTNRVIPYFAAA